MGKPLAPNTKLVADVFNLNARREEALRKVVDAEAGAVTVDDMVEAYRVKLTAKWEGAILKARADLTTLSSRLDDAEQAAAVLSSDDRQTAEADLAERMAHPDYNEARFAPAIGGN